MTNVFYYPVAYRTGDAISTLIVPWVATLPSLSPSDNSLVVLFSDEGQYTAGLYIWTGNSWLRAIPYDGMCFAIIKGSKVTVAWQLTHDVDYVAPSTEVSLWRNAQLFPGTVASGPPSVVWGVTSFITLGASSVSSVDHKRPDISGNITVNLSDLPDVTVVESAAIDGYVLTYSNSAGVWIAAAPNVGMVKSVSSQLPDIAGNVVIQTTDNNAATGQSLIVDSGSTTGNAKLKTIVGGSGITLATDVNGNLQINGTNQYVLPAATITTLGGVIVSSGLSVDGLGTLTANVLSVSGQTGALVIKATDNNGATGVTLISDSGATTADIKLKTLVAGTNVALGTDANGNIIISSTVSAGTITAVRSEGVGTSLVDDTGSVSGIATIKSIAVSGTVTLTPSSDGKTLTIASPAYVLPAATTTTLGGVIVPAGSGLSVDVPGNITLVAPTGTSLGGVKAGTNITIAVDGTINATPTGVSAVNSAVAAGGQSLVSASGGAGVPAVLKELVAGANITLTSDANGITIASTGGTGAVTSVALALPSIFVVSGSPVTSTGTLTGTFVGQNANFVFAGPVSGSANIPSFRALVPADLPIATAALRGAVIAGNGLTVNGSGVLNNTGVVSFNTRTGAVTLQASDLQVTSTGAFLLDSPVFTGTPAATTPTQGGAHSNDTTLATTAFVTAAITGFNLPAATTTTLGGVIVGAGLGVATSGLLTNSGVLTFNTRAGAVVLTAADLINGSNNFLLDSPSITGIPVADTAATATSTRQLATTAFVHAVVSSAGVTSFNTRTGAVTLLLTDVTNVGGAPIASPVFTGNPTGPTPTAGDSSFSLATTQFVATSFAPLASPTFTGVPAAPTPTQGGTHSNDTTIATTAFVTALIQSSGVSSFNTRAGAVTLQATDLQVGNVGSGAFILGSPSFTGVPVAPTATVIGIASKQITTSEFVANFYAPLASPPLTGVPTAPTASAVSTSSTQIATVGFVGTNYVGSASPALTGVPTAPTPTQGGTHSNDTTIATTAFVTAAITGITTPAATTTTLGAVIVGTGLGVATSGLLTNSGVLSFNSRVGAVTLVTTDVQVGNVSGGAFFLSSPIFAGNPTITTTPTAGDNTLSIASTAFVNVATAGSTSIVLAGNHTLAAAEYGAPIILLSGALTVNAAVTFPTSGKWSVQNSTTTSNASTVTLQSGNGSGSTIVIPQGSVADIIAVGNSVFFSGQIGITQAANDSTTLVATTQYVMNALGSLATGVSSFNTRTGAIVLIAADITSAGGALLASPTFTGSPRITTTPAVGDSSTLIADTAFVANSFAPLASPTFTGVPVAPTQGIITGTTQIATSAFVANFYAPLAGPTFTGVPKAPTPAQGDSSTALATTAFVQRFLGATVVVDIAAGSTTRTLTLAESSSEIIRFTSTTTMTASITITVPTSGQWMMYNATTGAFNVTISNGSGSTYVVPQNQSATILSLGTLGIVNANVAGNVLTPATATTLGGVIVPNSGGLAVDTSGNISVLPATSSSIGGVIAGAGLTMTGSTLSTNFVSFNTRTGAVTLTLADVTGVGGAPINSPTFTGTPLATTVPQGTLGTQLVTAAFVFASTQSSASVALASTTTVPLTAAQYTVPIIVFTGTLTANITVTVPTTGEWTFYNTTSSGSGGPYTVTISNGSGTTQVVSQSTTQATLLMSNSANGVVPLGAAAGVTSFNTRTGAVTLVLTDVTNVGGAPIASPVFTGTPKLTTTPTAGDNSTNLASTAFVATSFAPLASPTFTGTVITPNVGIGANNTQAANTSYVYAATQGEATIALTTGTHILTASEYSSPFLKLSGTITANVIVSFPTTGNWNIYNATTNSGGSWTVTLTNGGGGATLAIPQANTIGILSDATAGILSSTSAGGSVISVNGHTGSVVLTVTDIPTAAPLASPTFTGTPAAPTAGAVSSSSTQIATVGFVGTNYAPLASPTFTGRVQSPAYSFTVTALTGTSLTVNLSTATEYTFTITAATTVTFSGTPATGTTGMVILRITNGGAFGTTFTGGSATITYANKTAPTLTTSGVDVLGVLWDPTASTTTYQLFVIGLNVG